MIWKTKYVNSKYDLENKIFFLKSARITFKTLAT